MRDKRFVAEHRGGFLTRENHKLLIIWSCDCIERVLQLTDSNQDEKLLSIIETARKWARDEVKTGEAMKAAVMAIRIAKEADDAVKVAIARAAGHAAATAHMADHSVGGALYSLKATKLAGRSINEERDWQIRNIPGEIREMTMSQLKQKEVSFKLGIKSK